MRILVIVIVIAVLLAAPAAAQTPQAAREIDRLAAALGRSGCDFQRNGTWHTAGQAEEHLRRKYDYLRKRGKIDSAEQFIALAGTKSSMSGRAYLVRCPGRPVVDSATWLRTRLLEIRSGEPAGGEPR